MPIAVPCACGTTLRAPDKLAGKSVKCPKCSGIVKVPATANGAARPEQAQPKPAAAAKPARPQDPNIKKLHADDDDDVPAGGNIKKLGGDDDEAPAGKNVKKLARSRAGLESATLPPDLQEQVENELQDREKVIWVGQPNPKLVFLRNLWILIFGLVLVVAGTTWAVTALAKGAPNIGFVLGPILMAVIGAVTTVVPFVKRKLAHRSCYILTNKRAIVWNNVFFTVKREHYKPEDLMNVRRIDAWLVKGAGDVVFRTKTIITTTTYRDKRTGGYRGSSTSKRVIYYGFLAVDNAREVELLIRDTLVEPFIEKVQKIRAKLEEEEDEED